MGTAVLLAALAVLWLDPNPAPADGPIPKAKDGVMDLTGWDWEKEGVVSLSGTWRFEWKSGGSGEETTLEVPGLWHENRAGNGAAIPDQGYGVYRLTVLQRPSSGILAIQMPNILTAYELKINGRTVQTRGSAGPNAELSVPYQLPATVYLQGTQAVTEVELAVSNFHHRLGGIRTDLMMGTAEDIASLRFRVLAQTYITLGCLLMMGLYHTGLFAIRRSYPANLLFAVLCFGVALRMGLAGEGFLYRWFPHLEWPAGIRLEYLSMLLSGWAGLAYYHQMYPSEVRRLWVGIFGGTAVVLGIGTAALPILHLTTWLPAYQVYLLLICTVLIAGLIAGAVRKREGAVPALIGVAVMAAAMINDILFYNGWQRSVDLVPLGLLFLIIMNSFIIAMHYSRTFDRAEQLSAELKEWNNRLEQKIGERTEELRKSYESLEAAKEELERMETSRRQLVSNISHDLRTPMTLLQGYLEALRDGVIRDPAQQDATVRLMLGKVEGLNGLIQDLFELSVLEARKAELIRSSVTLDEWRERLEKLYGHDLKEKRVHFTCTLRAEDEGSLEVSVDVRKMDRVFANLIYNAVRYTPEGGWIRIVLGKAGDGANVEATVEDNGTGIDPDDLPHIFDRFYKKDKSRHSTSGGSGLGLAISREIVGLHGGTIEACNRPEGGGAFRIRLPIGP